MVISGANNTRKFTKEGLYTQSIHVFLVLAAIEVVKRQFSEHKMEQYELVYSTHYGIGNTLCLIKMCFAPSGNSRACSRLFIQLVEKDRGYWDNQDQEIVSTSNVQ